MISAASEIDLYNQLQSAGLELVECSVLKRKGSSGGFTLQRIKIRDLIQFFIHMEQMQSAGVPLLDALADIRDTTENNMMRDIMSEVYRDVSEGSSLSEALERHPKVFTNLYISLIRAGEDTGDLTSSYLQLVKYLKWVDEMQSKIRKATMYPMIVSVFILGATVFLMGWIVPMIVGFLENLDLELPIYTIALMATSNFFVANWMYVLATPVIIVILIKTLRKLSDEFCYRIDYLWLITPIFGDLIRKISIARYAQTFGALYASGIDVLKGLRAARQTINNRVIAEATESVEKYVHSGMPLSDAFNASGEFPSMVIRMLKIGEESGNLTKVLDQISEFYTKDVDEAVQRLITLIEPALILVFGGLIVWIILGVFGPIYLNLGEMGI